MVIGEELPVLPPEYHVYEACLAYNAETAKLGQIQRQKAMMNSLGPLESDNLAISREISA